MKDIKESKIKEFSVDSGEAIMTYRKFTKDDELYHIRYDYSDEYIGEGKTYCSLCGKIFPVGESHECSPEDTENYTNIPKVINDYLRDNLKVTITYWDGKEETYQR